MIRAQSKNELVLALELVEALSNEVGLLGGNDDHLCRILSDKSVIRKVAELLVGEPASDCFPLVINRQRSRFEMVGAGKYDDVDPYITEETFPVTKGQAKVEAALIHLDRVASDEEVLAELEWLGLRPATMDELCAFGEQHPDRRRSFPIIALGSVGTDRHSVRWVGRLWEGSFRRKFLLSWLGGGWPADHRFLAVRK